MPRPEAETPQVFVESRLTEKGIEPDDILAFSQDFQIPITEIPQLFFDFEIEGNKIKAIQENSKVPISRGEAASQYFIQRKFVNRTKVK